MSHLGQLSHESLAPSYDSHNNTGPVDLWSAVQLAKTRQSGANRPARSSPTPTDLDHIRQALEEADKTSYTSIHRRLIERGAQPRSSQ